MIPHHEVLLIEAELEGQRSRVDDLLAQSPTVTDVPQLEARWVSLATQDGVTVTAEIVSQSSHECWVKVALETPLVRKAILSPGLGGIRSSVVQSGRSYTFADSLLLELKTAT